MREAAYKGLVRPILDYGSSVWDPHYEGLIDDRAFFVYKTGSGFRYQIFSQLTWNIPN